ncbi:MAG TPA: hypothetical protein VJR46_08550 [Candidatus Dormibacteraeota bacterium]|nr:hypothetical protein [Candidatus Dormibacteraeota bacterium]
MGLAIVMLLLGGLVAVIGAWAAATGSRPSWMPGRALPPGAARGWGGATALGGLGLVLWGTNLLLLHNGVVQLVAALMILAGAAWVSVLWPNVRRPRRPQ